VVAAKRLCSSEGFVLERLGKFTKRVNPRNNATLLRLNFWLFVADNLATLENLMVFICHADLLAVCPQAYLELRKTSVLCINTSSSYKGKELIGTWHWLIGMDPEDPRSGYLRTIFVYPLLESSSPSWACLQFSLARHVMSIHMMCKSTSLVASWNAWWCRYKCHTNCCQLKITYL